MSTVLVRPTNGVSHGIKHTVASDEVFTPGVVEIITLSVTAGATYDGFVAINLRGTTTLIAVAASDTATQVATKIRAGTFSGWTTGGSTTTVTFTNVAEGAHTGAITFTSPATGVTGTISATTPGVTGVAEILNLAISGTASGTGSVDIVLRGASPVNIVVTDLDTATTIATSIRAGSYTGWTTGGTGTNVTFTKTTTGAQVGANTATFNTTTGVTGTFTVPTPGVTAVAEIITASVTTGATFNGNVLVELRGTTVAIAILSGDTATQVATKIRAGTFSGWTTGGSGTTVTFTKTTTGAQTGSNTITSPATGATGTISATTPGVTEADGVFSFDFRNGTTYRYSLVAVVTVKNSSNVVILPTNLKVTYPTDGVVEVDAEFTTGMIIDVVAQRNAS